MTLLIIVRRAIFAFLMLVGAAQVGFAQSDQTPMQIVHEVMDAGLARCYSSVDGVRRISFQPMTSKDFSRITALGETSVAPLGEYLNSEQKNGFTQLFAVKLLIAVGGQATVKPLKRALQSDQWDVTRVQALAGLFQVSPSEAKPYVQALLNDQSPLLRQRANDLWEIYLQQ